MKRPAEATYRLLLRLLPGDLRRTHGREMTAVFMARLGDARGVARRLRLWLGAAGDVIGVALVERGAGREPSGADPDGPFRRAFFSLKGGALALLRSPGSTLAVLTILTLGAAAPTAVFSVVESALLRPLPYPDGDRLVVLNGPFLDGSSWSGESSPAALGLDRAATFTIGGGTARANGRADAVRFMPVGPDFLSLLGWVPEAGRGLVPGDYLVGAPPVAVASNAYWTRTFGAGATPSGQTAEMDGTSMEIVGVLPSGVTFGNYLDVDFWVPTTAGERHVGLLGHLLDGVTLDEALRRTEAFVGGLAEPGALDQLRERGVAPVHAETVRSVLAGDMRGSLLAFLGASLLVLLIASANAANLLLARGLAREKEMAVRRALGASRSRLVGQLLTETGLLAASSALLALVLTPWATRALLALAPDYVPRVLALRVDPTVLLGSLAITAALTMASGVLPAVLSTNTTRGLRPSGAGPGRAGRLLESGLVVVELAAALVMVAVTGLLVRAFLALSPTNPGFTVEDRMAVEIELPAHLYDAPEPMASFASALVEDLGKLAGVERAELVTYLPLVGVSEYRPVATTATEAAGGRPAMVHLRTASPGYTELMEMPLVAGRRPSGPGEALVNEAAAARLWNADTDPLGAAFTVPGSPHDGASTHTVVGVVADARIFGGMTESRPEAFVLFRDRPARDFHVVLLTRAALSREALRAAVARLDPAVPVAGVASLEDVAWDSMVVPRFQLTLGAALGGVALLLAGLGAFATLSHLVARRRRELGVRMALGAPPGRVAARVVGRIAGVTAAGTALGLGASWLLGGVLERTLLLPSVEPRDPGTLATAALVLAAAAGAAAVVPALRASSVDPVSVLKED